MDCGEATEMPVQGHITAFTADHLDDAAALYVEVFNNPPWNDRWSVETARKRLADILDTPGFLGNVYVDHGLLGFAVGYCEQWHSGLHFYLNEMCVRTDRQRMGIGAALIEQLVQTLQQMQVENMYLLTMRDGPAEAFYAKHGFRTSPRMVMLSRRLV